MSMAQKSEVVSNTLQEIHHMRQKVNYERAWRNAALTKVNALQAERAAFQKKLNNYRLAVVMLVGAISCLLILSI